MKERITSQRSALDVLKEANERHRSSIGRTLLDMLRYRRVEKEIRTGRQDLVSRIHKREDHRK